MKEGIAAGILFLIAAFAFFMSIRSFHEKGFLFNNAYLYASGKEREAMDKKPYYRQSAVIFALIGIVFLLNGCAVLFAAGWLVPIGTVVVGIAIAYAIVSSIIIEKRKKRQ